MADEYLMHYGTKRHSGRYPWGSGENPYQRLGEGSIRGRVYELRDQGMSETDIATSLGMSTTVMRQLITLEKNEDEQQLYRRVRELHEKGNSNVKIGEMLGVSEGTVRNYLKSDKADKINQLRVISDQLKKKVDDVSYLDVGEGTHLTLNCSETKLQAAVQLLKQEGYEFHTLFVDQMGTNHKTTMTILCKPGTEKSYLYNNMDKIHILDEQRIFDTDGSVVLGAVNPKSVNSKRIFVRYGDEGGSDKDGVIELRRGVDDISLGKANYAQVRIAVDDKAYMKGMAIYSDKIPEGYDIIYNTNKPKGSSFDKVFKAMKTGDPNPFGASIKGLNDEERAPEDKELKLTQRYYIDKNGKKQLSCINIVNEEGTWDGWSRTLSSQFLSKQTVPLAKRQLDLAYKESLSELDDILKITEPTVKKNMLKQFSDKCDAAAVDLKAAALPRQSTKVLLPVPSLKENEIYAPTYKTGERVVLIRYPHGGIFEIPELTVNNNHKEGKSVVGNSQDAIGISIKTAQQLSGADFDGDTAIVIPVNNVKIRTHAPYEELKNFDPKIYKLPDDAPPVSNETKQLQMGRVSNLITDMTLQGAPDKDIIRAVRHSMVVIDSEKHHLDWKQSAIDNGIADLKKTYQGGANKGASTIISRASSDFRVPERRGYYKIDPATGERIFLETHRTYTDRNGVTKEATSLTTKMDATNNALTLTSDGKGGHPMEVVYARYANDMKALGNRARREYAAVAPRQYEPSAAETYKKEVESLETKLLIVQKNAPRERQAQLVANSIVKSAVAAHPEYKNDKDRMKKVKSQALATARANCGAKSQPIRFTDSEWEAIQSGAIKKTKLEKIIEKADKDELKQRATPKANLTLSSSKVNLIKAYKNSGLTYEEISQILGVSTSTINKAISA